MKGLVGIHTCSVAQKRDRRILRIPGIGKCLVGFFLISFLSQLTQWWDWTSNNIIASSGRGQRYLENHQNHAGAAAAADSYISGLKSKPSRKAVEEKYKCSEEEAFLFIYFFARIWRWKYRDSSCLCPEDRQAKYRTALSTNERSHIELFFLNIRFRLPQGVTWNYRYPR